MSNIATISFHDQSIIAIEHEGKHFVALRPIVENIGLDWAAQYSRIKRHPVMSATVVMMTTQMPGDDQRREVFCLPLSMLNGWLFGVDVNRVREEIRPKLIRYQTECFDVLYRHFMPKEHQPTPYTVQPSDTLNEPQQIALRAMLESNVKRLPHEKQAAAMVKGWSKLKAHFGVPYRQIPASEFTEALSIIARHVSEWELVEDAAKQPDAAPKLNAFMQALAAARENAMSYLNGFRKAVQAGQLGPRMDDIPGALLEGIVADALINSRFLAGFDQRTGKMHVQLVPHDASVFSFQSGDFGQAISAIPTKRLPELQDALSRRVAGHLAALQH